VRRELAPLAIQVPIGEDDGADGGNAAFARGRPGRRGCDHDRCDETGEKREPEQPSQVSRSPHT